VQYGTGVVLFFQFVKYMTYIFLFLTLMSIPQMIIYSSGKASSVQLRTAFVTADFGDLATKISLGNI
jgi:hypothetical protein